MLRVFGNMPNGVLHHLPMYTYYKMMLKFKLEHDTKRIRKKLSMLSFEPESLRQMMDTLANSAMPMLLEFGPNSSKLL
jgi:hypothetical protein